MPAIFPAALSAAGGGSLLQGLIGASPLISAGGGLLGGLASVFGARGMSQADAMALQYSTAMDMYREQLQRGPSWEMEGLRAAGINPMLRYGHGGAQPPMMGFSPSIAQPFNRFEGLGRALEALGPSAFRSFSDAAGGERSQADTLRTRVELIRKLPEEIRSIQANSALTEQQRKTEVERTIYTMNEIVLQNAQRVMMPAELAVLEAQVRSLDAQAMLNINNAAVAAAEAELRHMGLSRAEYDSAFFDSWFGEIVRGVHNTIGGPGR